MLRRFQRPAEADRSRRVIAAIAEVGLIFLGITLAIAFENWNAERAERKEERDAIAELLSDLSANVDELRTGLEFNRMSMARIDTVLSFMEERRPYSEVLSPSLAYLENWASPYLSRSAYETLKARGLTLLSDARLRSGVVQLYESVYADLVSDSDRAEWVNYEVSMIPLLLGVIEERPGNVAVPLDYGALLEDRAFRTALLRTKALRSGTVGAFELALRLTEEVLAMLEEASAGAT